MASLLYSARSLRAPQAPLRHGPQSLEIKMRMQTRWQSGWVAVLALSSACSSAREDEGTGVVSSSVIYGTDDRSEYGSITDPEVKEWADATAALVRDEDVSYGETNCALATQPFTQASTLFSGMRPLCEDQAYRGQDQAAFCT